MTEDGPGREPDSTRDAGDRDDRPGRDGPAGPEAVAGGEETDDGADEAGAGRPRSTGTPDSPSDDGGRDTREASVTNPSDDDTAGDGDESSAVGGDGAVQAVRAPPDAEDGDGGEDAGDEVPEDVRSYDRFTKVDRASYDRVNEFLRDRTYITAREWAIARLCADFRTATGVEMTKVGEHLPELVPFMTDTYSPQAVNQARSAFERKVRMAGATFLYGAMSGFFTADELDELMYEVTEVAKFLLEVEGVELTVDEELDAEDRISAVMREVRRASEELRYDEVACPHCGQGFRPDAGGE